MPYELNADFSSETELFQVQDKLYKLSKEQVNFHSLFEIAFNEVTIITAIHKIKSNHGANTPGVDGNKIKKYLHMDRDKLIELIQKTARNYRPKPAKRIYIEKDNGKLRPLGIPTILDRIIQECIRTVLEPIMEAKFYEHSYGFRPYRSAKHAVKQVLHFTTSGKAYFAIEGDIKGYFDNINHRKLLSKLWKLGIKDKRIIKLISLMLKAGYIESDFLNKTEMGTPQGGIISPLLANIYLNDFDWIVARRYYNAHLTGITTQSRKQREKLKRNGRNICYLVRYADDWIVLTQTRQEAERYLEYLRKYFKNKLNLELSQDKTLITDLREKPALFLGFDIKVEKPLLKPNSDFVGKNTPNHRKVSKQISRVCKEIRDLRTETKDEYKVLKIVKINQMIEGFTEYWKSGICSKTFDRMDYNINNSLFHTFKKMYPDSYLKHKKKVSELHNRPARHKGYSFSTFAINHEGFWIGVTIASITNTDWLKTPFNQMITPYTIKGRELYYKMSNRKKALARPNISTVEYLRFAITNQNKYNFEYFMNREYAYNRDKGVCRCCKTGLDNLSQCHHINSHLPMDDINKLPNLAWVCYKCHRYIHGEKIVETIDLKTKKKIKQFQEKVIQKESNNSSIIS